MASLANREADRFRWKRIALVYQNSLDVLNPVITVGEQIAEPLRIHLNMSKADANQRVCELLSMVKLDELHKDSFPHQLSGGMRQKVLIAMALACKAEVLLVDEPTMALDTVSKREIVDLLGSLQQEQGFGMIVISHEMHVIQALTKRTAVMYAGHVVEEGQTQQVIRSPRHPYTRGLLHSSSALYPYRDLWGIPGEFENSNGRACPFCKRCGQSSIVGFAQRPPQLHCDDGRKVACHRGGIITLLGAEHICKHYHMKGRTACACKGCSFRVRAGEVAAVIGQSGSGKTTAAEILSGVLGADSGSVMFDGQPVLGNSATSKKGGIQIVFQDPFSAINERLTIEQIVREPLDTLRAGSLQERRDAVVKALGEVHLPNDETFLTRRGHTPERWATSAACGCPSTGDGAPFADCR